MGCGFRFGGGELLEAVLVDGLDHARIARGDHMPAHDDVDAVDAQVFEDARVVGDDHQRAVAAAAVDAGAAAADKVGNVLNYHSTCCDNSAFSNANALDNHSICANKDVILNNNWRSRKAD